MRTNTKIAIVSLLTLWLLASCDDEDSAKMLGGGPGSGNPNDIVANDTGGVAPPVGGIDALGNATFDSGLVIAKIDFDGSNPAFGVNDPNFNPQTSGLINGQFVDAQHVPFVVMSPQQLADSGVHLGDFATATNGQTGQTVIARVEDVGPAGGVGEISAAAASAIGIQFLPSSATVGNPTVIVKAFPGTANKQTIP